jgi:hypothetical protein
VRHPPAEGNVITTTIAPERDRGNLPSMTAPDALSLTVMPWCQRRSPAVRYFTGK